MNKLKIKLKTAEDTATFIRICNKYISDINVYSGSIKIDAKSIVGMYSMTDGKEIFVEIISPDENEVNKFKQEVNMFMNREEFKNNYEK